MHKRFRTLCIKTGGLLGAGLFYALVCLWYGKPVIPCLFYVFTGFLCPGCGVSHMCLALLHLDLKNAFNANPAVFLLLPIGILLALQMAVKYVREGNAKPTRIQSIILFIMTGILLVFGILRNLFAFI